MKSILSIAAVALLGASNAVAESPVVALASRQYKTLVYEGCYSSSDGLSLNSSYTFNTKGYCQTQCVGIDKAVEATSNGDECFCGDGVPPSSAKVDDSSCDMKCTGYGPENCGANGFYSVYLTGLSSDVSNAQPSGAQTSSAHPKSSATTSASPSVVTIGGQTVVVTASAQTSAGSKSGSGPNKAAIAAGVVVGVFAIAAVAGGIFLFLRHRRRRAVEEEYRRQAAVSSFVNGGKVPPGSAGGSSLTDTRLDPSVMAQRRMSDGSIADNQDYSRRILKVTNA